MYCVVHQLENTCKAALMPVLTKTLAKHVNNIDESINSLVLSLLWPLYKKSQLIGKDPDAGKGRRRRR